MRSIKLSCSGRATCQLTARELTAGAVLQVLAPDVQPEPNNPECDNHECES